MTSVPVFPALWVPHTVTMSLLLRAQLGDGWRDFSRRHPLSCFAVNVLYVFSGAVVGALVLGEPLLEFFSNAPLVAAAAASWYLVFYAPFDALAAAVSALRLRVPLVAMQDFMRVRLVLVGVQGGNSITLQNCNRHSAEKVTGTFSISVLIQLAKKCH